MLTKASHGQPFAASIYVPGLYSLQCISRVSGAPDITVYRESLDTLINNKDSQLKIFAATKRFSRFILAHDLDKLDVYDNRGKRVKLDNPPTPRKQRMLAKAVDCRIGAMVKSAAWLVKNPTVCGVFEGHTHQSAADRSNFYALVDKLINVPGKDADREQLYILTGSTPCVKSALIANLSHTSERTQGSFLDTFKRLRNGWPLSNELHRVELGRTLAGCRYADLSVWSYQLRLQTHPKADAEQFRMTMMALPASLRLCYAGEFTRLLYDHFHLEPGGVEYLQDDLLRSELAKPAAEALASLLASPIRKI